jgi:hypothetical protein
MRRAAVLAIAGTLLQAGTLYEQSVARVLDRDFPGDYLLVDARTGEVLASRWPDPEEPVPVGSLVKPFLALAYGEAHSFRFPRYECRGCWLPKGHGRIGIVEAIAHSCNRYFLELARGYTPERGTLLGQPPAGAPLESWIGLGAEWKVAPVTVAQAYGALARSGAGEILHGLALAGREGTARGLHLEAGALVKTGTAPCVHGSGTGDGYVAALFRGDAPAAVLLLRVHGVPGAQAAVVSGRALRGLKRQ